MAKKVLKREVARKQTETRRATRSAFAALLERAERDPIAFIEAYELLDELQAAQAVITSPTTVDAGVNTDGGIVDRQDEETQPARESPVRTQVQV